MEVYKNEITLNCLAFQLSQARKKVQKWYEQQLSPMGLSTSYVYVMEVIKEYGPSSLTFVAQQLEIERATASTLLSRMERDDFIIRRSSNGRRSIEIHLTEKGHAVLQEALSILKNTDSTLDELLGGNLEVIKTALIDLNKHL